MDDCSGARDLNLHAKVTTAIIVKKRHVRRLSEMPSRRRLQSSLTHQLDVHQSQCATVGDRAFATATVPLLVFGCGTVCQPTLSRVTHFHSSAENLKHFYLDSLILIFCF